MFDSFFGFRPPTMMRQHSDTYPGNYTISLKAFPAMMHAREDLEPGNKSSLSHSVKLIYSPPPFSSSHKPLLPTPMIFSIQNTMIGSSTNVGVLEFTADDGTCILPNWMFESLNLDYGTEVILQLQKSIQKGKFCKLQPHKTEFIELPDPRAMYPFKLFESMRQFGETTLQLRLSNSRRHYQYQSFRPILSLECLVNVKEVQPKESNNCICLIEADVEVDFAPPLDYVEKPPSMIKKTSSINLDEEEEADKGPFSGQGIKINGQKVDQSKEIKFLKKVDNEEYDPRKHRLTNGVVQYYESNNFKETQWNGISIGGDRKLTGIGIKKETDIPKLGKQPSKENPIPSLKKEPSLPTSPQLSKNLSGISTAHHQSQPQPTQQTPQQLSGKNTTIGGQSSGSNTSKPSNPTQTNFQAQTKPLPSQQYTGYTSQSIPNTYQQQSSGSSTIGSKPTSYPSSGSSQGTSGSQYGTSGSSYGTSGLSYGTSGSYTGSSNTKPTSYMPSQQSGSYSSSNTTGLNMGNKPPGTTFGSGSTNPQLNKQGSSNQGGSINPVNPTINKPGMKKQ